MFRTIFAAMAVFAAASLMTPGDANAHWWNKVEHSISKAANSAAHAVATGAKDALHDTEKAATTVAKDVKKGAKAIGKFAKENARKACDKAVPVILGAGVGKACKVVATEFGAECNAALDIETEGMAAAACTGGAVAIWYECKTNKFTKSMISSATHEICSKI